MKYGFDVQKAEKETHLDGSTGEALGNPPVGECGYTHTFLAKPLWTMCGDTLLYIFNPAPPSP